MPENIFPGINLYPFWFEAKQETSYAQFFKYELLEDNALLLESAFKRLKKDSYTFKNEGNKRQYEHQKKVLEFFSQAQTCITSNKSEKAAEKIEQSITLV